MSLAPGAVRRRHQNNGHPREPRVRTAGGSASIVRRTRSSAFSLDRRHRGVTLQLIANNRDLRLGTVRVRINPDVGSGVSASTPHPRHLAETFTQVRRSLPRRPLRQLGSKNRFTVPRSVPRRRTRGSSAPITSQQDAEDRDEPSGPPAGRPTCHCRAPSRLIRIRVPRSMGYRRRPRAGFGCTVVPSSAVTIRVRSECSRVVSARAVRCG